MTTETARVSNSSAGLVEVPARRCRLLVQIFLSACSVLASPTIALSQNANNTAAQENLREHIQCSAYWKIQTQCLPTIVPTHQRAEAQKMFEQLTSVADTLTEWLGEKAQLSTDAQQRLEQQSKDRLFGSIGGKCERTTTLISTYRDKCAALFTANSDRWKAEMVTKAKDDLSDVKTIKDAQMDCDGTLDDHDDRVPIGKERKASAFVHVMGGGVLMATIRPEGMPMGMLTGEAIGAKPDFLRYKVTSSTFRIGRSEAKLVGVDRVNAEVSVMLHGEKSYTFWFKCKVRKPQF